MNEVGIIFLIIYCIGYAVAFYLVRLDFKKTVADVYDNGKLSFGGYVCVCFFALFSWVAVLAGLVINGVRGNFTK